MLAAYRAWCRKNCETVRVRDLKTILCAAGFRLVVAARKGGRWSWSGVALRPLARSRSLRELLESWERTPHLLSSPF